MEQEATGKEGTEEQRIGLRKDDIIELRIGIGKKAK